MFGDVWRWAGTQRTRVTNIGVEPARIPEQTKQALDDVRDWHEHTTHPVDDLAARLHRRLVAVQPCPNGNGRCTRLIADLCLLSTGEPDFTWGPAGLSTRTGTLGRSTGARSVQRTATTTSRWFRATRPLDQTRDRRCEMARFFLKTRRLPRRLWLVHPVLDSADDPCGAAEVSVGVADGRWLKVADRRIFDDPVSNPAEFVVDLEIRSVHQVAHGAVGVLDRELVLVVAGDLEPGRVQLHIDRGADGIVCEGDDGVGP